MSLSNPWILTGLLATAVPIWLHLITRDTPGGARFPSLMFVKRVATEVPRRKTLRDRGLLALRVLGLVGLVAAFAGPNWPVMSFLETADEAGEAAGEATVPALIIALDISASMRAGKRWDGAMAAARSALAGRQPDQALGLLLFAEHARWHIAPSRSVQTDRVQRAVATLEPGYGRTRFGPVLRAAAHFAEAQAHPVDLVLITDLPANRQQGVAGWPNSNRVRIHVRPVDGSELQNVSITKIEELPAPRDSANRYRAKVVVTVRNNGEEARARVPLHLRFGTDLETDAGARAQEQSRLLDLGPGEQLQTPFDIDLHHSQSTKLLARIEPEGDAFAADNERRAVATAGRPVRVLLDFPDAGAGHATSISFLEKAFSLAYSPPVDTRTLAIEEELADALAETDVLVSTGPRARSVQDPASLKHYLDGGGALLFLADDGSARTDRIRWPPGLEKALDVELATDLRLHETGLSLVPEDVAHPLAKTLGVAADGPLSDLRIHRSVRLDPKAGALTLARATDGRPMLTTTGSAGSSRIAFAFGLDPRSSTLGTSAGFAELMPELVQHAAGRHRRPRSLEVGDIAALGAGSLADAQAPIAIMLPNGDERRLAPAQTSLIPELPGFYSIVHATPKDNRPVSTTLAVNLPDEELDLSVMSEAAFQASLPVPGGAHREATEDSTTSDAQDLSTRSGWWAFLLAALLCLGVETVIAPPVRVAGESMS